MILRTGDVLNIAHIKTPVLHFYMILLELKADEYHCNFSIYDIGICLNSRLLQLLFMIPLNSFLLM